MAGQVGYGPQVSLRAPAGATIRYTTNGSTPTGSSTIYTGPHHGDRHRHDLREGVPSGLDDERAGWGPVHGQGGAVTFSPDAGTYTAPQVDDDQQQHARARSSITRRTASIPTASDPVMASGGTVVAGNYTLKARAYQRVDAERCASRRRMS